MAEFGRKQTVCFRVSQALFQPFVQIDRERLLPSHCGHYGPSRQVSPIGAEHKPKMLRPNVCDTWTRCQAAPASKKHGSAVLAQDLLCE